MSNYEIGTEVNTPNGRGEVASYKAGWYTITMEDGNESKFREKQLSPVVESTMSNQLNKYRTRYQRCIAASGSKSMNNGDEMAQFLEYKDHVAVAALADIFTPLAEGTHLEKYAKLNNGQIRMNSGNKLRAAYKKGTLEFTPTGELQHADI